MPSSVQSWSNSCSPDGALARDAKSRSVNSFPLAIFSRTNGGTYCTNDVRGPSRKSSVVAWLHEQTHIPRLQGKRRLRPIDFPVAYVCFAA